MIEVITRRIDVAQPLVLMWNQGGRDSVVDDTNCTYALNGAVSVQVRHLKQFKNGSKNRLMRTDSRPGEWEDGNFAANDILLWTDTQTAQCGPIVIAFQDSQGAPMGVHAAGANIQSWNPGEFTACIRAVDLSGVIVERRVLGQSNAVPGTALFIGTQSDAADIMRIEFRTTNIVEDGHAAFDAGGFAINQLSVTL
jgi:hypothetical protein